jgi:hypothetical protein
MTGRCFNAKGGSSSFIEQCFALVAEDLHWRDSGAGAAVLSQAVRDKRVNLIIVPQMSDEDIRASSFAVPKHWKLPTVILLGDDMRHADGPRALHKRSVRIVLENADGIVLMASGSSVETSNGLEPLV